MNGIARSVTAILTLVVISLLAHDCLAVQPASWNHASEADFARGECKGVAITSRGELMLARRVQLLMQSQSAPSVVSCLALGDGAIYAGSGSSNVVYRLEGSESTKFAEVPGAVITSLLWTGGGLLAGTGGGDKAGIYSIDANGKATLLWSDKDVKYVWAMLSGRGGVIYAATGPKAGLYAIANGKGELVYQLDPKLAKNLLCLAGSKNGGLYAGTDVSGLVVEVNLENKTAHVLLDAAEKEVTALVVADSGDIYAATAEAGRTLTNEAARGSLQGADKSDKAIISTSHSVNPATMTVPAEAEDLSVGEEEDGDGSKSPDESGDDEQEQGNESAMHAAKIITMMSSQAQDAGRADSSTGGGNCVYHIHKDGLVSSLVRRPLMVLAMIQRGNQLMLGAGNGAVYEASMDGEDLVQLVKTEAGKITALCADKEGRVIFATANKGGVAAIGSGIEAEGTFTSRTLDARQIAKWGTLQLSSRLPAGTSVMVSTRSGNVGEPSDKTWGNWSKELPAADDYLTIASPAGRFLQYRLRLIAKDQAGPCVKGVSTIYQVGNLAPQVQAVTVVAETADPSHGGMSIRSRSSAALPGSAGEGEEKAKFMRRVTIKASDPNNDQIVYSIYFREVGTENWIRIADKLTEPQYQWDTRTVADGQYELRVEASDRLSNPPDAALEHNRLSQVVCVDNTPATIKDLLAKPEGAKVIISGSAVDATRIAAIRYSVDSQQEWTAVLPVDGICDSNKEDFSFQANDLKAGPHRIAVRVEDIYGNVAYGSANVTMN